MSLNTLNLKQKQGGRVIKQADRSSTFKFALQDANGALMKLDGQSANISLHNPNNGRYWETSSTVRDGQVEFSLPGNLASDDYILEIACNGYVFPSDNDFVIEVVKGYKELLNKETAESTRLTFSEIRKEVENEAKEDLEKQIIKINGVKASAINELSESKSQSLKDIENAKSNSLSEISTNKNQALSQLDNKFFDIDENVENNLDKLEAKTQDGLKKIGDKTSETLSTIDNKKSDTLQGLETTRKNFESNIDEALTQAIKAIPYEKFKGDKGDSPRIVDQSQDGLTRTYTFNTTDTIVVKDGKDGKDGTINIAEMSQSQLADIKRQLEVPAKEDFVDIKNYTVDKESINTKIKVLEDGKADKTSLINYSTKDDIEKLKNEIGTDTKARIENLESKKADKVDLKAYAKTTDIPDVSGFLTSKNLEGYAKTTDIPKVDLSSYVTNNLFRRDIGEMVTKLERLDDKKLDKSDWTLKVDKVNGKGLSTNDFTDAYKKKVINIPPNPKYTDTTYTGGKGVEVVGNSIRIKNQNSSEALGFWVGTEAEYNRIYSKDVNTIYFITE